MQTNQPEKPSAITAMLTQKDIFQIDSKRFNPKQLLMNMTGNKDVQSSEKEQEPTGHDLAQTHRQPGLYYPLTSNKPQVCSENGGKIKQKQEVEG